MFFSIFVCASQEHTNALLILFT